MQFDTVTTSATGTRLEAVEVAYHSRRRLLVTLFLIIGLVQTALWFLLSAPRAPILTVSDVQLLTASTVCPGDTVLTRYVMTVTEPGVVDVDMTIMRPSGTNVLSRPTRRIIFPRPMTITVEDAWRMPSAYDSSIGDPRRWQAGEYERLYAVTTVSRGSQPVILEFPFRIGICHANE